MPFVSAGVYSTEIDLSLFAETVVQTILGVVGTFNKGPVNDEIDVTTIDGLVSALGKPIDPTSNYLLPQAWYAGREFLRKANQLKVVRAESTTYPALYSGTSLPGGTDETLAAGDDGVTSIPATRTLTPTVASFIAAGVVIGDVVEVCDVSSPGDNGYYVITLVAAGVLTVDRDWPVGGLTALTYKVHSGRKEAGLDGVTSIPATRQLTSAGSTFVTNGVVAGDILKVATSGLDDGVYVITTVAATVLTVNRDWPKGGLSAQSFVVYGASSKGADGSTAVAGTFSSAGAMFALHGVKAGDILLIKDAVDTGNNGYYVITGSVTATSFAVGYNRAWAAGALTGLTYEIWPGSVKLLPQSKGTWLTNYLVKTSRNSGNPLHFDLEIWDPTGVFLQERIYDCDRANIETNDDVSVYLAATVSTLRTEPACGSWAISTATPPRLAVKFSGGDDGTTSISDGDYLTALAVLRNPEQTQLNLIAIPGQTSQNIGDGLVAFAESRADCLALIDPPDWATLDSVQDILDWHNGILVRTAALNTSYGTLAWTWQQLYDEYNDEDVWTAPSGHVAAVMAYTDNIAYPWFAPAGLKRGLVTGSKDVRYSPTQGDRDAMQNGTQCVNPIVNFVGQGITLFGQKTLLRSNSALNRTNVRRMLLTVEAVIAGACRYLTFEPNDDSLFREFIQITDPVLQQVLTQRGIQEYKIVNATTTADRENVTLRCRMFIKPTKAAEIIVLEFVLTSQGANFEELLAA